MPALAVPNGRARRIIVRQPYLATILHETTCGDKEGPAIYQPEAPARAGRRPSLALRVSMKPPSRRAAADTKRRVRQCPAAPVVEPAPPPAILAYGRPESPDGAGALSGLRSPDCCLMKRSSCSRSCCISWCICWTWPRSLANFGEDRPGPLRAAWAHGDAGPSRRWASETGATGSPWVAGWTARHVPSGPHPLVRRGRGSACRCHPALHILHHQVRLLRHPGGAEVLDGRQHVVHPAFQVVAALRASLAAGPGTTFAAFHTRRPAGPWLARPTRQRLEMLVKVLHLLPQFRAVGVRNIPAPQLGPQGPKLVHDPLALSLDFVGRGAGVVPPRPLSPLGPRRRRRSFYGRLLRRTGGIVGCRAARSGQDPQGGGGQRASPGRSQHTHRRSSFIQGWGLGLGPGGTRDCHECRGHRQQGLGEDPATVAGYTPRAAAQGAKFHQPLDASPQCGAEAVACDRDPAERPRAGQAPPHRHERGGQQAGATGHQQAGLVGRHFAGRAELPPRPPRQRLPPQQPAGQPGQELPGRVPGRQVGDLVGQDGLPLARIEVLAKTGRNGNRRPKTAEHHRGEQPVGRQHADRPPQAHLFGQPRDEAQQSCVARRAATAAKSGQEQPRPRCPARKPHGAQQPDGFRQRCGG